MKKKLIDLKLCGVCGDKALGFNFNAVTCESCKAFFRRNALTEKDFKCPFNQHCEITVITRRFCQRCRLQKCFNIGMSKNLIMSEEDKEMKRQKVEENRARKRSGTSKFKAGFKKIKKETLVTTENDSSVSSNTDSENSKDTTITHDSSVSYQHITLQNFISTPSTTSESAISFTEAPNSLIDQSSDTKTIDFGSCSEFLLPKNESTTNNNVEPELQRNVSTNDVQNVLLEAQNARNLGENRSKIDVNPIDSILSEAIKLEYETSYLSIPKTKTKVPSSSRELNDAERAKLNELIVANKALLNPIDDDLTNSLVSDDLRRDPQKAIEAHPGLLDVINLTAIIIRRLIKMAKKINSFKNMCQEDQVALLKGGCTEIMILRSVMNYNPTKQTWEVPYSQENLNLNADVLKLAKGNIYQEHERFSKTFDPKWRADENIILIMCAITLFCPDRQRIVHQDVVQLEQNSYYYLLRRYLESIYPGCEAKSTFLKLIQKIVELHKLNEELINVYLDVNPSQVEPLLIEIFDLKCDFKK